MKRIASSAAAMALAAMALVGTAGPSSAATQHCPDHTTADKVELNYNTTKRLRRRRGEGLLQVRNDASTGRTSARTGC